MRVLAFDPGYERLGIAVIERVRGKEEVIFSDCVRTPKDLSFPERLLILGGIAEALIKKYTPEALALEEVYFEKNAKTAMKIAEVRGMLIYLGTRNGLSVHQFSPSQVKVAITGYGKAAKGAVELMVHKLVSLPKKKRLDDEVDAIAVGITCLASVR